MISKRTLKLLFSAILIALLGVTTTATLRQPLWEWQGLVSGPDRWWTIATFADAYCGFLTFYAWVFYKERTAVGRLGWGAAILLLGNIATASYVLREISRLGPSDPLERLLLRNHEPAAPSRP